MVNDLGYVRDFRCFGAVLLEDAKSGTFLAEIFFALNLFTWCLFRP